MIGMMGIMSFFAQLESFLLPKESNNHKPRALHARHIFFLASIVAIINLFSQPTLGPAILGYASNIQTDAVISLTNAKRSQAGLNSLSVNPSLSQAASEKAAHMFSHNYWAHVAPDGTEPWYFITHSGYKYLIAGENLARDFNDSSTVVEAWMNSPSHKDNLLNPKYQEIGVAVVNGKLNGVETTLVVQMFGTKLNSAQANTDQQDSLVQTAQALEPEPTIAVAAPTAVPTVTFVSRGVPEVYSPAKMISPLTLTRGVTSLIIFIIIAIFIVDAFIIWKNKVVRVTSDTAAHIAFLLAVTIAIWLIKSGIIL